MVGEGRKPVGDAKNLDTSREIYMEGDVSKGVPKKGIPGGLERNFLKCEKCIKRCFEIETFSENDIGK